MQPKILFLTRALDIGGAQRQLVELAVGLHGSGWDVKVVTFYAGGALDGRLREAGVPMESLGKAGRWDVLSFGWRLAKLLRREKAHIAHGYLDLSNILLTVLRRAMPDTRVVWGVRASNMDGHPYDALFRFEVRLGVLLSRFADLIICNSEAGRDHHVGLGYLPENMTVVPNGIDVARFRPDAAARTELRAEWGVAADETLIGLIGRLDPMKDPQNFLHAAARLASARPELRFVCAGDGPEAYRHELKALAGELGIGERVLWSPARVDVWRVYNALDVCVSSSAFGEGFSNTIAEAMATGVPCVVTNVGDSATVVGDRGWVCPPRDNAALAHAIEAALRAMPADAAAIRQRIAVNYGSPALLRRTVSHLTRLLGPASAARYMCDQE